jgi:hypothetical protein
MATGRIYLESGVGRLPGWHRESAATPDNRGLEILRQIWSSRFGACAPTLCRGLSRRHERGVDDRVDSAAL